MIGSKPPPPGARLSIAGLARHKRPALWLALGLLGWALSACLARPEGPISSNGSADGGSADGGLGASDAGLPLRFVVVLIKENHTFDNLFGAFPGANGSVSAKLSDGSTRPLAPLGPGPTPGNPSHFHADALTAWNHGQMNGFDLVPQAGSTSPALPFSYFTQADIPNYYAYAAAYALCDNFFSLTLSDSFPGYVGLIGATSFALDDPDCGSCNWGCDAPAGTLASSYDPTSCSTNALSPCLNLPSIVDGLPAGLSWRTYTDVYGGQLSSAFAAFQPLYDSGSLPAHTRNNASLLGDLTAGDVANLTFIWGGNASEHPPQDICPGENDTVRIANALMQSPTWSETLLIVTYDDWGGFYDHVAPPGTPCSSGELFSPGFRVPTLLISPYSRAGPFHGLATQASIDQLIEAIFGLPPLAQKNPRAQDSGRAALLDAFDFTQAPKAGLVLTPRSCP